MYKINYRIRDNEGRLKATSISVNSLCGALAAQRELAKNYCHVSLKPQVQLPSGNMVILNEDNKPVYLNMYVRLPLRRLEALVAILAAKRDAETSADFLNQLELKAETINAYYWSRDHV